MKNNYKELMNVSIHEKIELKGLINSKKERLYLFGNDKDIESYFSGLMGIYLTGKGGYYNAILIHLNVESMDVSGRKVNDITKDLLNYG